jgi:hypothetical protein
MFEPPHAEVTVLHKDWYAEPELVLKRIEAAVAS